MKKLLYILLFVPLALFGQEPISYQLSSGWNMVGYTGCEITPIDEAFQDALGNGASLEETFLIIKDVRGIFWHQELGENSSLTHLTPGEGYMMYVNNGQATTVSFSEEYCNDITYQLNSGWNMVGYTGTADNNGIVEQMDAALGNGAGIANTFQVIKNVTGHFWSAAFTQIEYLTPGKAYMMYVHGEPTTVSFTENSTQIFENNPGVEFTLPVTDDNMSVVFPSGSFVGLEGAQIHAITMDEQIVISETYTINDDGSVGVSLIGTDNICGCDLANSSTQPEFVIENGEVSSYVFANQLQYTANGFQVINYFDIYGNCDFCIGPAFGCTDVNSDNYNSSSLLDNGTCYRYGCMSDWADNFDILATIDDGTCYKYGCMLDWADNYNINATNDDDSCFKLGCTNVLALNYDESVTDNDGSCEYEIITQLTMSYNAWNVSINLQEGWNMFGYGCPISIDLVEGFSNHIESITLVKDNNGSVYMPEFGFNGIGDLSPGYGYQIKLSASIEDFSICGDYINNISNNDSESIQEHLFFYSDSINLLEDNIVSLQDSIEILNSEIFDLECVNQGACSFNIELNECEFAQEGYDCEGNFILQVGDYGFGGIIFHIDESGNHGLVVLDYDLTSFTFGCYEQNSPADSYTNGLENTIAMEEYCGEINEPYGNSNIAYYVRNTSLNGYDDWYIPAKEELSVLMNNLVVSNWSTVNGIAYHLYGFSWNKHYGSSSEDIDYPVEYFRVVYSNNGASGILQKFSNGYYFRPIRSF